MAFDFSKKNTKEPGGKFGDRDLTFGNTHWIEQTSKSGTFTGIYLETTFEEVPDTSKRWLLGDAEKLRNKIRVTDDGTLEEVDSDNPYTPRTLDETSQLFNSLEDAGLSLKILNKVAEDPSAFDGITVHFIERPTGKKQKKDGVETQYDQTVLVAESIVSGGESKSSGKTAAGAPKSNAKPSAAATSKKPAPVVEPDEDDEEETDDESSDDPTHDAAVATIQAVLATPKKFVPNFNARKHAGGVEMMQVRQAALGNAIPKEFAKIAKKAEVAKLLKETDVYEQYNGELWNFDADEGVITAIDE